MGHSLNRSLCTGVGNPGVLNHITVCESVRNLEELLYALYCLLDPGLYWRFFGSVSRMALEWVSRWHEERRCLKPCQVVLVLQYPGSDPVCWCSTRHRISQQLLSGQFNRIRLWGTRTTEKGTHRVFHRKYPY